VETITYAYSLYLSTFELPFFLVLIIWKFFLLNQVVQCVSEGDPQLHIGLAPLVFSRALLSKEYGNNDKMIAGARTFFPLFPSHSSLKRRKLHRTDLALGPLLASYFGIGPSRKKMYDSV
jgi:hypothetical protein